VAPVPTAVSGPEVTLPRRRNGCPRLTGRRLAALAAVLLLVSVLYSYVTTMIQPSSLPLGVRTVEWIRANHGAWIVDEAERFWYSHNGPRAGGPQLTALPTVGLVAPGTPSRPARPPARPHADYAPAPIRPLIRPALPEEGRWQPTSPPFRGSAPVLVTTYRTDPTYPQIVAFVAWFDHTRTQLALYPGRYEPPNALPRGPMEVPSDQRWRLLATFNSGFTFRDGHGGFAVNGHAATPLVAGIGTVVAYGSGQVDVVRWHGGSAPPRGIVLARQNLPLIVAGGRPNPNLSDSAVWGQTLGNAIRVWRSGVGVDRRGNLIYAAANYQTVGTLARILIHAGAVRAVELDINAEWPSLITYPRSGARDPVKIVPNSMQSATRYLVPDDRDFFAVYKRVGAASAVPFR